MSVGSEPALIVVAAAAIGRAYWLPEGESWIGRAADCAVRIEHASIAPAQYVSGTPREIAQHVVIEPGAVDPLTGLTGRATFTAALARRAALERPLTLVLFRVAGLTAINAAHGHRVGDEVLSRVAELVRAAAERAERAGRTGGNELALLLAGPAAARAGEIAGDLGGRVAAMRFGAAAAGARASVRLEATIATLTSADSAAAAALLSLARAALGGRED